MPRSLSSGALSMLSYDTKLAIFLNASTFVMAAVKVVLPWSTCPMVPTFTCGFVLSNFAFDMLSASCREVNYSWILTCPVTDGAHERDRTADLILTKDVLYRL